MLEYLFYNLALSGLAFDAHSSAQVRETSYTMTSTRDAAAAEQHLLFILLDSNLPTGGFISSSGLESYAKHGFLKAPIAPQLVEFARAEVANYARASLGFVRDAWNAVQTGQGVLDKIKNIDKMQEAMMLNHVARRSSKAQGVAMLTLFSKGFSKPAYMAPSAEKTSAEVLMDEYKKSIRRGEAEGHLNVCWGVITAALGVSLGTCTPFASLKI